MLLLIRGLRDVFSETIAGIFIVQQGLRHASDLSKDKIKDRRTPCRGTTRTPSLLVMLEI